MERVKPAWGSAPVVAVSPVIAVFPIIAVLLSACFPSQAQLDQVNDSKHTNEVADRLVGHEFWLPNGTAIAVYETPSMFSHSRSADGRFRFDSKSLCSDGFCTFHVTFASTVSGYIRSNVYEMEKKLSPERPEPSPPPRTFYPSFLDHLKAQDAARRRNLPGVAVGMDKVQVIYSAWGEPDRKTEIHSRSRHREIWYYPDGNELRFEDDRLVEIKN